MTTCEAIHETLDLWQGIPRDQLPDWLRNPATDDEFDHAVALYGATRGITPICENGQLVAWAGIREGVLP